LDLSASHVRRDRIVELDGERQPAEIFSEAADDALKRFGTELPSANDFEHDGAVFFLNGLKLADQLSPSIAQEHVKHDARKRVSVAIDDCIRASTVDSRDLGQAATTGAWERLSRHRHVAVDVSNQWHSVVVKIRHDDVAGFARLRLRSVPNDFDQKILFLHVHAVVRRALCSNEHRFPGPIGLEYFRSECLCQDRAICRQDRFRPADDGDVVPIAETLIEYPSRELSAALRITDEDLWTRFAEQVERVLT
jgi:hypothetical protein